MGGKGKLEKLTPWSDTVAQHFLGEEYSEWDQSEQHIQLSGWWKLTHQAAQWPGINASCFSESIITGILLIIKLNFLGPSIPGK